MIPADDGPIALTGTPVSVDYGGGILPMMLYPSAAVGPAPAVVICPGGTGGGMFEVMEWAGSRLQAAGYTALTVSWRDPSPLDDVEDIRTAIAWLQRSMPINGHAIAVFGASRGANAALRATAIDHRIAAAVTFGAATDLVQLTLGSAAYAPSRHEVFKAWLGDPVTNRPFYDKVQAIAYADRITKPLLMMHGRHDFHCPVEQSIAMKNKVEASGNAQVELQLLPFVGHYGDVVPNGYAFNHIAGLMIEFLDRKMGRRN